MRPQVTASPLRVSTRRPTSAGTSVTTRAAAVTRSVVRCGRAVWPPGPSREISSRSQAEVIGPTRSPIRPASTRGSQCTAMIRPTPSSAPHAIASAAPPGSTSSAGWKISRTGRRSRPSRYSSARTRAAPSTTVVCTSWPQACARSGTVDRYAQSILVSGMGSASMSARSAITEPVTGSTSPMSQIRPVPPPSTRGRRPAFSRRALIAAVVRNSWLPSSGCMCRSRRKATSSARSSSGRAPGSAACPAVAAGSASDSRDISCFTL